MQTPVQQPEQISEASSKLHLKLLNPNSQGGLAYSLKKNYSALLDTHYQQPQKNAVNNLIGKAQQTSTSAFQKTRKNWQPQILLKSKPACPKSADKRDTLEATGESGKATEESEADTALLLLSRNKILKGFEIKRQLMGSKCSQNRKTAGSRNHQQLNGSSHKSCFNDLLITNSCTLTDKKAQKKIITPVKKITNENSETTLSHRNDLSQRKFVSVEIPPSTA